MPRLGLTALRGAMAIAPALLALSCGRSLVLDARLATGDSGAGGASTPPNDGGGGAGAGGAGNVGGSGGTPKPSVDASTDHSPPPPDASTDTVDAYVTDVALDRTSTPDVSGCPVDCTMLPHVLAGAAVPCVNGVCVLSYGNCEAGFSHCTSSPNVGCETALIESPNCGGCGATCYGGDTCRNVGGYYYCVPPCQAPTPDTCGFSCVDLQSDLSNCGACGNACYLSNTKVACQQGQCAALGCIDTMSADCTSDPGCETTLGYPENCGGCNDPSCTLANTMFTCSDGLGCNASVCEVGAANCDTSSPDCETFFESATPTSGSCLPQYLGTIGIPTAVLGFAPAAIAPDGSFFLAGAFQGMVDFDPSAAGEDVRTAFDTDGFVTKFNADGSYAWTSTLTGRGALFLLALAVTPSGGVVAAGSYQDTIDLDPSAAQDIHVTSDPSSSDTFVVELAGNGREVWGRTFASTAAGTSSTGAGISVDAAGGVYVAGSFSGTIDFDPSGGDVHGTTGIENGFLVKLSSTGDRAWSHVIDAAGCSSGLQAVAVATDGSAWTTGRVAPETTCALTPVAGTQANVLIVKVNAAGDTPTMWSMGDSGTAGGSAIAASHDGAVYIGGIGSGAMDMDPGPGVARRWLGSQTGFVLKLAADGSYQWARSLTAATNITSMAPAPDGGVITSGSASGEFVTRLTATGASVWTFPVGFSLVSVTSLASNQTSFVVGGTSSEQQDFDPGPAADAFDGDLSFVSRFKF